MIGTRFIVCVHDVCPRTLPAVAHVLRRVWPLVGTAVSVAAIPLPRGRPWDDDGNRAAELRDLIRQGSGEVLLHGLTHRREHWTVSPLSSLIGGHDEFARLPHREAVARLRRGRQVLADLVAVPVTGVLPPAWRAGRIPAALAEAGLDFIVGMTRAAARDGRTVPLATWSWDAGRVAPLGGLLDLWGTCLSWRTCAIPCVALHPADVARGFLPAALARVEALLRQGRRPVVFSDLWRP